MATPITFNFTSSTSGVNLNDTIYLPLTLPDTNYTVEAMPFSANSGPSNVVDSWWITNKTTTSFDWNYQGTASGNVEFHVYWDGSVL